MTPQQAAAVLDSYGWESGDTTRGLSVNDRAAIKRALSALEQCAAEAAAEAAEAARLSRIAAKQPKKSPRQPPAAKE